MVERLVWMCLSRRRSSPLLPVSSVHTFLHKVYIMQKITFADGAHKAITACKGSPGSCYIIYLRCIFWEPTKKYQGDRQISARFQLESYLIMFLSSLN